jgi:hypothetical protein
MHIIGQCGCVFCRRHRLHHGRSLRRTNGWHCLPMTRNWCDDWQKKQKKSVNDTHDPPPVVVQTIRIATLQWHTQTETTTTP